MGQQVKVNQNVVMEKPERKKKKRHYGLLLLLLVTLIIRGSVVFLEPTTFNEDPDNYRQLAENLEQNGIFGHGETPTAFRPPLYPFVLRQCFRCSTSDPKISRTEGSNRVEQKLNEWTDQIPKNVLLNRNYSIALLHWGLGLFTVFLVWQLGRELRLNESGSIFAGFLIALDPILLQQSRLIMTETMATFMAVIVLWILMRSTRCKTTGSALFFLFLAGILAGVATLCRPAFLGFALLVALTLFCVRREKSKISEPRTDKPATLVVKKGFTFVTLFWFLLGLSLVLAPWAVRNARIFGFPILTTTHSGYTMLLANNKFLYEHNEKVRPWEGPWDGSDFQQWWTEERKEKENEASIKSGTVQAELFQDRLAREEAWDEIKDSPKDFFNAMLIRIGNLWQPIPYQVAKQESGLIHDARHLIGLFYIIEYILMFVGAVMILVQIRRKQFQKIRFNWFLLLLLILSVQFPHLVFWTNMRMRAPILLAIALIAGACFGLSRSKESDKIS